MKYKISDLLSPDVIAGLHEITIDVPEWAFQPDAWNTAFLRGLRKRAPVWNGKRVWELGVGTGINQIVLAQWAPRCVRLYSDYDHRCTELAKTNIVQAGIGTVTTDIPVYGRWDLTRRTDWDIRPPYAEVIFGCLPQVPKYALGENEGSDDRFAHYYDPSKYPDSHLHICGLGLNDALLAQARKILPSKNGEIILNLGGRPGLTRLQEMFEANGFKHQVLHYEIIPQHPGTSLATLAQYEQSGAPDFEFFSDRLHCNGINARGAERLRTQEREVFHRIYVIAGTPV